MPRLHVQTPNAVPMDRAVAIAFEQFGAPVLGGASGDGWSKQADFQRCPYRYYLMHEKQIVLPGPMAPQLEIGILWHAALACHYHRLLPEGYPGYHPNTPGPDALLDAVEAAGAELANVSAARRLIWGYLEHWPLDDVQPVALEHPAGVHGVHTCRFDMVGWYEDELWVFEHKCLPATARVYTKQGTQTLSALMGADWQCAAYTIEGALEWRAAKAPQPSGVQEIFAIWTRHGRRTQLGGTHPVLTRRGWIAAKDLVVDDEVAVALNTPEQQGVPSLSPPALYVLGALLADGALTNSMYSYTKRSRAHLTAYVAALRELPLSKRQLGILLGGLFAGHGSIGVYKERRKNGQTYTKVRICYGSRSRRLCADIADALAALGITASVTDTSVAYKGTRRVYHYATVTGRAAKLRFLDLIDAGFIPAGPLLKNKAAQCRRVLATLRPHEDKRVQVDGNVWWDRVVSNLSVGFAPVFNVEVPDVHTFVVDGLVTHNSAAKETEELMDAWFLDGEVLGEMYGWRLSRLEQVFGARLSGVVINIGFKSNPPRYRRLKVVVPEVVLQQYVRDRAFWNAERESYRATGYWPRKLQGCLSRYNDVCGFFQHCRDGNDLVQIKGWNNEDASKG